METARRAVHPRVRGVARAVFPSGTWPATVHAVVGLPIGALAASCVITMVSITLGLTPTVVLGAGGAAVALWVMRGFTTLQRSRFRALLGVEIPAVARPAADSWWRSLVAQVRSPTTWRQLAYHVISLPMSIVAFVVVVVTWSWALALSTVFTYAWALPSRGILDWPMRAPTTLLLLTVCGLALLGAAPRIVIGLSTVDAALARALLGPSRAEVLATRMVSLERSRADTVDAADAERRRIERDLHDGAQQRLVSLAMNLGMARAELRDTPGPVSETIAHAHDEAKQALAELRDLVRGLHPAVLDDRGLDAALSGIAARAPQPVRLSVKVTPRCSATIEAIAYFIVSESLTNIAKHAHATKIEIEVRRRGDRLSIRVTDDGRGGAVPAPGGGLAGLAQRASSVDGRLRVDSPPGGPTVIDVELPCES